MEMLESFNEQFGDALKDIEHYGHGGPDNPDPFAKTAVQTSKYIKRLFSITKSLKQTLDANELKLEAVNSREGTGLLALRASSLPPSAPVLEDLHAAGLRAPGDYVRMLTALNVRVNAAIRSAR